MNTPEFQAVEREMAPRLAAFRDRITQDEALFRRIAAVYEARESGGAHPRAEAPRLALLHDLRPHGGEARPRRQEAPLGDQPAPGHASTRPSPRTSSPTRPTTSSSWRARATSPAFPTPSAPPPRRPPSRAGRRASGPILNTRSSMEPFLDLLREARPAREGLADLLQPRRQRRREGQQQDDHRDPRPAGRAREAPRLRDLRALEPRGHDGEDAGAGHGPHGGGLDAGRRPRPGGGRRDAGDRRPARGPGSGSRPGTTATTRRRSARPSTTSTRTR